MSRKVDMPWKHESLREALGRSLVRVGERDERVLVVNADLRNSVKTTYFMERFPERTVEVGIAEQNMIGISAGLASMGFLPFAVTFARFASKRAADQISMSVDYCRANVRIIGAYAGIFTGMQGVSQQMIDDTAAMRSMPNMTVIDTADVHEIRAVLDYALEHEGPMYVRVGRDEWPVIFDESYRFVLGKGVWLREGQDVALLSSGVLLPYAIEAAELLAADGIQAAVVNMPTVKPLDSALVTRVSRDIGAIVTLENHNVQGGFGSAVAESLAWTEPCPVESIGIQNMYSQSAPNDELAEYHGLTATHVVSAARRVIARKEKRAGRQLQGT